MFDTHCHLNFKAFKKILPDVIQRANAAGIKKILIEFLQEKDIRVVDMGAYQDDPLDDFPDFAHKVAQAVLQNPQHHMGNCDLSFRSRSLYHS